MSVLHPWHPVEAEYADGLCRLSIWGRQYTHDHAFLPTSLLTQGKELLAAPIRLTGRANDEEIIWEDQGCYLIEPTPECAIVNGYAQSACLLANTTFSCEYDGAVQWDIKIMPRGLTVPQIFGIEKTNLTAWNLQSLRLEIPLRKDACSLYTIWPRENIYRSADDASLAENDVIPAGGLHACFKPALWLGNEDLGLQLIAESDALWQNADANRAMEILDTPDAWVLRVNLLDSLPDSWTNPNVSSRQIGFRFGLMATPVKPVDKQYLQTRAVHIDCFTKIAGDYWAYLNGPVSADNPETVLDRLCRAGVNLLILHEKWNKMQNYWQFATTTADEIHRLVRLCHSRGIRVIPYFGYEITSSMPEFLDIQEEVSSIQLDGQYESGWYRVPYQRANPVCYHSRWGQALVDGILHTVDKFDFDGVYLDGTTYPRPCVNRKHGCGFVDKDGRVKPTYPIFAARQVMRGIYAGIHARHGIVNPHHSGSVLPIVTAYSDMLWDGEHIQMEIRDKGLSAFSLPYFRAEYTGRNQGLPVQFIVYEFGDVWTFDMALSLSLIHGVYPRPNSVYHPLDVMERVWNVLDAYGVSQSEFVGYWAESRVVRTNSQQAKVSYYIRSNPDGSRRLLVYVGNPTGQHADDVEILCAGASSIYDVDHHCALPAADSFRLSLAPFEVRTLEVILP